MGIYIEVERGVKLYVEDIGSGRPVVLIHGWPLNRKMWEYQMNSLPQQGYRCILIDMRGFGRSDAPLHGYTYNRMADDIRVVVDELGVVGGTLVGFSMGGGICIRYIARHAARRVCGLVLAAAAAPKMSQDPDYAYGKPASFFDTIIQGLQTDRPKETVEFGDLMFHKPVSVPFRGWFDRLGLETSPFGAIKAMKAIRDEDLRDDLACIRLSTTILHGISDLIVPFELGELQHKGIQGSVLVPFEESGHGLFYDQREKFNAELLKALQAHS